MSFHAAAIDRAWDETRALRGIRLEVPVEVHRTHRAPGQYLKLRAGEREGFFALASAPGAPVELLVKRGGAVGDALAGLATGATVETSDVQGKGYPVDECAGRDLLLFAAGSGITPIRSVIEHVRTARARFGRVMVFYGQRHPDEFAYAAEHDAWAASTIDLVKVLSGDDPSWSGARGHVQQALLACSPSVEHAAAFLCGMKGMVAGVTEALSALGLSQDRIYLNY